MFTSKFRNFVYLVFFICSTLPYSEAKIRLALDWKPEPEFGGFYAAEDHGLYKEASLDLEIIPGGAGTPTAQVVAAGKAEFGICNAEAVLISRSHGSDLIALFAVYQNSPRIILTHAERDFASIADVFRSPGTLAVINGIPFFSYLLKKYPNPKVKVVPYQGGIAHFLRDPNYSQQAYIHAEPLLAVNQNIKIKSFKVSEEGYNPYEAILVTRKSYLEKNLSSVKAVVKAVRAGWGLYLENPRKTNEHMHKLNPSMDLPIFDASARAQKDLIETKFTKKNGLGAMSSDRWQNMNEQLKGLGLIEKIIDVAEIFQNL